MSKLFFQKKFDSITEYGAYARHLLDHGENYSKQNCNDSDDTYPSDSWDNSLGLDGTMQIAESGGHWEGAPTDLTEMVLNDMQTGHGMADVMTLTPDVVGIMPIVPNYIAGIPQDMLGISFEPQPYKSIKIGVCAIGSCDTTAEQFFNRGFAIIQAVRALELQGYAVELWAALRITSTCFKKGTAFSFDVCLKQQGEPISVESIAFALCNSAYGRRLGFLMSERHKETAAVCWESYGTCNRVPHDDFDVWLPYLTGHQQSTTPKKAVKEVQTFINDFINSTNEKAA